MHFHHQLSFLCVHAPRGHVLSFFAPPPPLPLPSSSSASSWSLRKFIPLWPVTLAIYSELKIFAFFSVQTVVFLALWFVNFLLTFFKACTSYGYFHYVSYGIFAHWFSLNQMFKCLVSFATEVSSTKDLKRATGHLSPPTNNVRDLQSLSFSWNLFI